MRNLSAGRSFRSAPFPFLETGIAAAMAMAMVPAEAQAQALPYDVQAALQAADGSSSAVRAFYKAHSYRPLWIRSGTIGPEADRLLRLLETADADGLDPSDYRLRTLAAAIDRARSGHPTELARTEMLLSRSLASYVRDVRKRRGADMHYVDQQLRPKVPTARAVLEEAASAPSLQQYLDDMGWMNPIYGKLRQALAAYGSVGSRRPIPPGPILALGADDERVRLLRLRLGMDPDGPFDARVARALKAFQAAHNLPQDGRAGPRTIAALNGGGAAEQREILRINLERARALPTNPGRRYVLVDAAAARLWMYEDGRVRDTMRVVVGKPNEQTPMMAGLIRFAMVNPYWNIPPDLVRIRVAPEVLKQGDSYLRAKGYEILSDWTDDARLVDPAMVDWHAVAAGRQELRIRQLPGRDNAMGNMKFMFPNALGIYLHDTPEKQLLRKSDRRFSSGCVRVEDAPRLARWLFGQPLKPRSGAKEQQVDLPEPVPVLITYLTAAPEGQGIAFRPDVYNRDGARLAALRTRSIGTR